MTDLDGYDMIFGQPWLREFNPVIDWKEQSLQFQFMRKTYTLRSIGENSQSPQSLTVISEKEMTQKGSIQEGEDEILIAYIKESTNPGMPDPNEGPTPILEYENLETDYKERFESLMTSYGDVFKEVPPGLPQQRAVDHIIDTEPNAKPPFTRTGNYPTRS